MGGAAESLAAAAQEEEESETQKPAASRWSGSSNCQKDKKLAEDFARFLTEDGSSCFGGGGGLGRDFAASHCCGGLSRVPHLPAGEEVRARLPRHVPVSEHKKKQRPLALNVVKKLRASKFILVSLFFCARSILHSLLFCCERNRGGRTSSNETNIS